MSSAQDEYYPREILREFKQGSSGKDAGEVGSSLLFMYFVRCLFWCFFDFPTYCSTTTPREKAKKPGREHRCVVHACALDGARELTGNRDVPMMIKCDRSSKSSICLIALSRPGHRQCHLGSSSSSSESESASPGTFRQLVLCVSWWIESQRKLGSSLQVSPKTCAS